jgi:hypothetical protein
MENLAYNSVVGLGSVMTVVDGLRSYGPAGLIGIVTFFLAKVRLGIGPNDIVYHLKIGLDGAGASYNQTPLHGAGGGAPNLRIYDNQGALLSISRNRHRCISGHDNCILVGRKIKKQPAYVLLQGRSDPICLAAVSLAYGGGDQFSWVGNWAHTCGKPWQVLSIQHGVTSLC